MFVNRGMFGEPIGKVFVTLANNGESSGEPFVKHRQSFAKWANRGESARSDGECRGAAFVSSASEGEEPLPERGFVNVERARQRIQAGARALTISSQCRAATKCPSPG